MPFVKVYIHFVWSTKNREPLLTTREIREKVWRHIYEYAKEKGIYIDFINGYAEHCHCLVSLGVDQSISKIMNLLKGESSFWINQKGFCDEKFEWQNDYYAVSVSESMLEKVRNYIRKQEEHHKTKSFQEEYDEFISRYGFKKLG
ncbi:IS200/IS605 family transposase [Adhaeribacter soli]|uniref:IS200/IS605 family transposase n=1 Tax=Adhaeribacter soli TaxID=2607655 RepID=A0A5N1J0H5_9BACT|nr:IS200/IS605 family transposase [Adhaeribacter soli]KAA9340205.1 IS200/IS605 family transposase [Adhaeribacter soli]